MLFFKEKFIRSEKYLCLVPRPAAKCAVLAGSVAAACAMMIATPAQAQVDILVRQSFSSDFQRSGVGLRFEPFWTADWGNWKATLSPELELSHFRYKGSHPGRSSLNQVGGIAQFRVHYGNGKLRPYLEAGLGGALFSHTSLGNKQFSTAFQFSEHIGAGVEFSNRWYLGYQYSHYSNADIKKPNSGLDLSQVVFGLRF